MEHWAQIWHQAITKSFMDGKGFGKNKTIIFQVRSVVDARKLRIKFSNRYGSSEYHIGAMKIKCGNQIHTIQKENKEMFSIPCGESSYSDEIDIEIAAGDTIEIRMYYLDYILDNNMIVEEAILCAGNCTDKIDQPEEMKKPFLAKLLGAYNGIPTIEAVEVYTEQPAKAIVAFGDSITAQGRWTNPLAERLEKKYKGEYVLLNSGISGNCLLYEPEGIFGPVFGQKGIDRFERDVWNIPNLHTVVIALGVNDVSYFNDDTKEQINLESFCREITDITDRLHEKGVRVVMQTITPRMGVARTMGKYSQEMENQRLRYNEWIRSCGIFDYVYDAEYIVKEEHEDGIYFKEGWHAGDHLHPNKIGGNELAKGFELEQMV